MLPYLLPTPIPPHHNLDHHFTLSSVSYLVPIHCFEPPFHGRVRLLSFRRGYNPILYGALERDDSRELFTVDEGQNGAWNPEP